MKIPEPRMHSLKVYDLRGKEIRELFNMRLTRGVYSITYDAGELSSGIYFYTMSNNLQQNTLKMLVLK